jgi:hypothetical protein
MLLEYQLLEPEQITNYFNLDRYECALLLNKTQGVPVVTCCVGNPTCDKLPLDIKHARDTQAEEVISQLRCLFPHSFFVVSSFVKLNQSVT